MEVQACWDHVDRKFDAARFFGDKGAEVIGKLSAQACAHEFPFAICLATSLLGGCNGATVSAFAGQKTPLSLVTLVFNPAQTRKSGMTSVISKVAAAVDSASAARCVASDGQATKLHSCLMSTFTEASLFQRASAGWDQRVVSDPSNETKRFHFSLLLSLDESYRFLRFLGLSGTGANKASSSSKDSGSGPTDAGSQWNALLQTGRSSMACKVGASYEAQAVVTLAGVGNIHPPAFLSLCKSETGHHDCAVMERMLWVTGRPVSPHASLPAHIVPEGFPRLRWVPLLPDMIPALHLPESALHAELAAQEFPKAECEEAEGCPAFHISLGDGTDTLLRFKPCEDARGRHWSQAEFAVGNRDLPVSYHIEDLAMRVLKYFEVAHMELSFEPDAKAVFLAYAACFNSQASVLRDACDLGAARQGIGPYHLAILSASHVVWDIAVGQVDPVEEEQKVVRSQKRHVLRAYDCLKLIHELLAMCSTGTAASKSAIPSMAETMSEAQKLIAALDAQKLPESRFDRFDASQAPDAAIAESEAQAVDVVPDGSGMLGHADVPTFDVGYGPDGASVQDPKHGPVFMSDRAVMLRTLMRGEPIVFARRVVDSCSKKSKGEDGKAKRVSLKMQHWIDVMEAGLRQYRIGELVQAEDSKGPRLKLQLPDSRDPLNVQTYHNRLMALCGLTFSALSKKMVEVGARQQQKASVKVELLEEEPQNAIVEDGDPGVAEAVAEPAPKRKRLRRGSAPDLGNAYC